MRILVTAGPTREFFDTVRFISNPSSGKMGYALARAAARRGHEVVLVSGPVALKPPSGVETIQVISAAEMSQACKRAFPDCHAVIATAAVCDYRPEYRLDHKLKKQARTRSIRLLPTEDILASLGRRKGHRVLIGFAMEDHSARPNAESKLRRKSLDAILLNGPENIGGNQARMELLLRGGKWDIWPAASKNTVATRIIRLAEQLVADRD
ncbi:MAG: phosphopantothenoylcysteine decarboxylase [Phycisphaerae bacterium]|nr:phosphopantothenoylcysteine decarboxylase [Phycisphaerae bacterium]